MKMKQAKAYSIPKDFNKAVNLMPRCIAKMLKKDPNAKAAFMEFQAVVAIVGYGNTHLR